MVSTAGCRTLAPLLRQGKCSREAREEKTMSPQSVPRQRGSEKEHRTAVERLVIMGAAGRDFPPFNTYLRDNPAYEVVAFTAAQIPGIADRHYPPVLSGARYPQGIPIGSVACKVEAAIEFLRGGG